MTCNCMFVETTARHSLIEAPFMRRQAPESLTSLDVGCRTLEDWGPVDKEGHMLPNAHVLQGFFGLRSLSCHVRAPTFLCCIPATSTLQHVV